MKGLGKKGPIVFSVRRTESSNFKDETYIITGVFNLTCNMHARDTVVIMFYKKKIIIIIKISCSWSLLKVNDLQTIIKCDQRATQIFQNAPLAFLWCGFQRLCIVPNFCLDSRFASKVIQMKNAALI